MPALKQEVHITAWIAAYAMGLTAAPKRHRDNGCTHAHQISPVSKCRAIPIRSCFGLSRTESDSQGCQPSAKLRQRITFGTWSITCVRCPTQSSIRFRLTLLTKSSWTPFKTYRG